MHLLSGTIALHEEKQAEARIAFETASQEAKDLLSHCEENYEAFDIKALALCGLAVCNEKVGVGDAIRDFETSRTITEAEGIIRRFEQLFSEIEKTDTKGLLRPMRLALPS